MTRTSAAMIAAALLLTGPTAGPVWGQGAAPRTAVAASDAPGNTPSLQSILQRCRSDLEAFEEARALGEAAVPGLGAIVLDRKVPALNRFAAANVLGELGSKKAVQPLLQALKEPHNGIRMCAAEALGKLGDPSVRPVLAKLARDDPIAMPDPQTGKMAYPVREAARKGLEYLDGQAAPGTAGLQKEKEIFLDDASKLPASPVTVKLRRVAWPFKGSSADQRIWNNYQQPTDTYIHAGLDFIHEAGTEVTAIEDGFVACIATNYPDWKTHYFFIVTPDKGGREGWCYTHIDPDSYTFKVGDRIRQGQVLGKLVDFYVGKNKGADHLHLHYVSFETKPDGKVEVHSLLDPLLLFDWQDAVPPQIDEVMHFARNATLEEFPADKDGVPTVSGRVEIIAGISDTGGPEQFGNWGVPVVTIEITGERCQPWRKVVLDGRGPMDNAMVGPVLYLTSKESEKHRKGRPPFPRIYFMKVTRTDGDGVVEPTDTLQAWDTVQRDDAGQPRFPDGLYKVTVRAWDIKSNLATRTASVRVANQPR